MILNFWTMVLEKTLESPLDCKEIKPVNAKLISPECSLEGLMLKLKLHIFVHLIRGTNSLENTLMLGKIKARGEGNNRRWDGWMEPPTLWTWVWASSWRWWWTGKLGMWQSMGSQRVWQDWLTELNWTNDPDDNYFCWRNN